MQQTYEEFDDSLKPAPEQGGPSTEDYRKYFATGLGAKIMAERLIALGLFAHLTTEADMARHNAGISLLVRCGVLTPVQTNDGLALDGRDMQKIVERLFQIKEDR